MNLKKYRDIVILAEAARETLVQERLPVDRSSLDPVMSEETLNYHYGKLASNYVKRYNAREGDDDFNYGGAVLHNLFFPQLQEPASGNKPKGISAEIINKKWKNFKSFQEAFSLEFMKAQGSNWLYMDHTGAIKTIHNHEYRKGMKIALLIDGWEHAWALDYQHDKQKYLDNIWRIIDWEVVNIRLHLLGA
jgi:Fe-Mn family superoxide dismutase